MSLRVSADATNASPAVPTRLLLYSFYPPLLSAARKLLSKPRSINLSPKPPEIGADVLLRDLGICSSVVVGGVCDGRPQ